MLSKLLNAASDFWDSKIPAEIEKRVKALPNQFNEYGYDEWGFSEKWTKRALSITKLLYDNYFRVETHGIEHIPEKRVMLVANHSSQMAYDALLIGNAMFLEAHPPRAIKSMIERFFAHQPFYAQFMPRTGQVIGSRENCIKLLEREETILVFPEGEQAGGKLIFNRYKILDFIPGFMRLAMQTQTPIVPVGFIGGEEMVPSFSRQETLAKALGWTYVPLSPTGPFPLPTKCTIHFGEPILFDGDPFNNTLIQKNVAVVREQVKKLVENGLKSRKSIFA